MLTPTSVPQALSGSLGAAVDRMGEAVDFHDLYDRIGAAVYDDSSQVDPVEVRWLRRHLPSGDGQVLELAAGNGRLTEPLLKLGIRTTALELSEDMLEQLRHRVDAMAERHRAHLVAVHRADMTDFALGQRFDAIVLMAASISLLDEAGRGDLFDRVTEHLGPRGEFLFTLPIEPETTTADDLCDLSVEVTGRSGTRYRIHQLREPGSPTRTIGVYPLDTEPGAVIPVCVSSHRVLPVAEVLDQVARHGLRVVDTEPGPLSAAGVAEVFVRAQVDKARR